MNEAERKALLELWRDVPECKPKTITVYKSDFTDYVCFEHTKRTTPAQGASEPMILDEDSEVAALARDAIVEWLMGRGVVKQSRSSSGGEVVHRVYLSNPTAHGRSVRNSYDSGQKPTRLLALIAAARAVKGASNDQPST